MVCCAASCDARNPVQICKNCFYKALEDEVHRTITDHKLFSPGEVVAMGASGGKDSTVLIHIMKTLNDRYKYVSCPHAREWSQCATYHLARFVISSPLV